MTSVAEQKHTFSCSKLRHTLYERVEMKLCTEGVSHPSSPTKNVKNFLLSDRLFGL